MSDNPARLSTFYGGMQLLLDKFDDIRRLTHTEEDIKIPTVIVVGDQSMGKSSLLEIISGIDLPRGDGTKTRVPLELQLRRAKTKQDECVLIYADFGGNGINNDADSVTTSNDDDKKYDDNNNDNRIGIKIDPKDISKTVDEYTERLAGSGKNIVDKPIRLTVYRENLVDLTLIDLPGLVRNVTDDTVAQNVHNMVERYIKREETIILNVVSCMVDLEIVESIKMSKKYDKDGKRTLLVNTFVDRIETGNDIKVVNIYNSAQTEHNFFQDRIFFVRNRSGVENKANLSLSEVQSKENEFFESKKIAYSQYNNGIPSKCLGSYLLTKKLVEIQTEKILNIVPDIKNKLYKRVRELTNEIDRLQEVIDTPDKASFMFYDIIQKIFQTLNYQRDGLGMRRIEYGNNGNNTKLKPFVGNINANNISGINSNIRISGVEDDAKDSDDQQQQQQQQRMKYICSETLDIFEKFQISVRSIKKPNDFQNSTFISRLETMYKESRGFPALPGTMHPSIALRINDELLEYIKEPAMELIDTVCDCMEKRILKIINNISGNFPNLQKCLSQQISLILDEHKIECRKEVKAMIERERDPFSLEFDLALFNRSLNFIDNRNDDIVNRIKSMMGTRLQDHAKQISDYWLIVCNNICRAIPMSVRDHLVNRPCTSQIKIQTRILKLNKNNNNNSQEDWFLHLVKLDPKQEHYRKKCEKTLKDLRLAKSKVDEIVLM